MYVCKYDSMVSMLVWMYVCMYVYLYVCKYGSMVSKLVSMYVYMYVCR